MKYAIMCILMAVVFYMPNLRATHLMGGYITYKYLKTNGSNSDYEITLYLYRDCTKDGSTEAVPFDSTINICVFYKSGWLYNAYDLPLISETLASPQKGDPVCNYAQNICSKKGIYQATITLPDVLDGYHLRWERCCRDRNNLKNDNQSLPYQGETFYTFIPGKDTRNSGPVFPNSPVDLLCMNDTALYIDSATDGDGDSLSYKMVVPWQGASVNDPMPAICDTVFTTPIDVDYATGYGLATPFGSNGYADINSVKGTSWYMSKNTGSFALTVEVTEWRAGVAINKTRLDKTAVVIDATQGNKYIEKDKVDIYPNPTSSVINIKAMGNAPFEWQLVDMSGRILLHGNNSAFTSIPVYDLSPGLYNVIIISNQSQIVRKISVVQ